MLQLCAFTPCGSSNPTVYFGKVQKGDETLGTPNMKEWLLKWNGYFVVPVLSLQSSELLKLLCSDTITCPLIWPVSCESFEGRRSKESG